MNNLRVQIDRGFYWSYSFFHSGTAIKMYIHKLQFAKFVSVKPNHSRSHIHSSCYPFVTNHPSQWSSHTPTCLHYFLHLSALPVVLNGTHQIHNTATFTTYTSAALLLHLSPTHSQVFCLPSTDFYTSSLQSTHPPAPCSHNVACKHQFMETPA